MRLPCVGIGTLTPLKDFHVNGSTRLSDIDIFGNANNDWVYIQHKNDSEYALGLSGTGRTVLNAETSIDFKIDGTNKMILKIDGSNSPLFGIGTNSPSYPLHVAGSMKSTELYLDDFITIYQSNTANVAEAANKQLDGYSNDDGIILEWTKGESGGLFINDNQAVIWSAGDGNRLLRVIDEDGFVEKFYIDGAGNPHSVSDRRLKNNIQELGSVLDKVNQLKSVSYTWKQHDKEKKSQVQSNQYGFIAQEVEKVFPDVVNTDTVSTYKSIAYQELVPILTNAIQELDEILKKQSSILNALEKSVDLQNIQITEQNAKITKLENELEKLKE